jgi:hypothetical protein
MAHYAFLNKDNIVTQVIVGKNENELDNDGNNIDWEKEYEKITGQVCKRTSYNTFSNQHRLGGEPFRKNYAGVGFIYDSVWDAFYPQQPFSSWKLNYETFLWEAPTPAPEATEEYSWYWSEINKNWEKVKHS